MKFRVLVARPDVGSYCAVLAMDQSVIEVAGEDYWDETVREHDWPTEYDYAEVTVTLDDAQVSGAFPTVVEVVGAVVAEERHS